MRAQTKLESNYKKMEENKMQVVTITKENFEQEVINSEKKVLLDFWAEWCMPCRMLSPVVDEFAETHAEVKVGKVNVDEQRSLAERYEVMTIPTLIVFEKGKEVKRSVGVIPMKSIEELLK